MSNKYVSIDFEYSDKAEPKLDLICCSLSIEGAVEEYWLRDDITKLQLKNRLKELRDTHVFLVWNYIAEGQSFIALGLHPVKFKVIDLQIEYRMLMNHFTKWTVGTHLKDGKKIKIGEPKYGNDKIQIPSSLSSGIFRLLDIQIDTDHKEEMRDICIRADESELNANKKSIQDYCTSDIKYLKPMWDIIRREYKTFFSRREDNVFYSHIYWRAETMARTALMASTGYPVDVAKMKTFASNVKPVLKEVCEDINSQFEYDLFAWNNTQQRYSKKTKLIKELIEKSKYADIWKRTETGNFSTESKEFEKHFPYRHNYPRGCPFSQYLRYLKTETHLKGFTTNKKNDETIFDRLGSDGRVRAYLNPYGSQTARYQPKAKFFIPLKGAWLRSLVAPVKGKAIVGIDYKSQEFLIAALISKDKNMIKAYESGDVYLYFAKLAEAVPWDGKKEDYSDERNLFKSTTLGISYLMGPAALGRKLTADTGKLVTTEKANELIKKFKKAYPDYATWQEDAHHTYKLFNYWMLEDGWTMFGGNPNERSMKNMPVQGLGSAILRKAIALAQDAGLKILYPLHDAVYMEIESDRLDKIDLLIKCMKEAFGFYFEGEIKEQASRLVGCDVDVWSPDYTDGECFTPEGVYCTKKEIYIDPRGKDEYEKFKKYMEIKL